MTTNYASLGCVEGEEQNVRQWEQHPAQRSRWSDSTISSPESAAVFRPSDDLNWRKSSSSISNATDANNDSFHTATDDDLTGWSGIENDAEEADGSHQEMTFHPGSTQECSGVPEMYSGYVDKLGDYDNIDDANGNSLSAAGNRGFGRDRRTIYVPSHADGPQLDVETEELAPPPDTWKKPRLVSSQTEVETKYQRSQHLIFERVVLTSTSSPTVVPASGLQTERAEEQIISSPLPRQLTMKSVSMSSERESSSSSLTSPLAGASPVTDRGECLVVQPSIRREITVKPKPKVPKIDSYHGSKYGGSTASGAQGEEVVCRNQTSHSRPPRRSRNDVVVKAVVSETPEFIQATLVEPKLAPCDGNEEEELTAASGGDFQTLQHDEGLSLPFTQPTGDERTVVQMILSEDEGRSGMKERRGSPPVSQPSATAYEDSDSEEVCETAGQPLPMQQELQVVEKLDERAQIPSGVTEMDEDKEDAEEQQQQKQRQVIKSKVEVNTGKKEETIGNASEVAPSDNTPEDTRLQRQKSIHPQRKPRENKRKAQSRVPPSSTSSSSSSGIKENVQDTKEADSYRILPATGMEEFSDAKPLHYYREDGFSARTTSMLPYPTKTSDLAEREMGRERPTSKSGMDRLKKKTRSGGQQSNTNLGNAAMVVQREESELKSFDTSQGSEVLVLLMDVVLHKNESGYGLTIEGSQPVHVKAVREHGIAEKSGILPGDEIVKINGTYVYEWEHDKVIKLIKAAGQFLSLTLQRDLPSEMVQASGDQLSTLAQSRNAAKPKATQSLKAAETNHQKPKSQSQVTQSFSSGGKSSVRVGTRVGDGRGGGGGRQGADGGSIRNPSPSTATPSISEKAEFSNKENVSFVPGAPALSGSTRAKAEQPAKAASKQTVALSVIGMENDELSEEEDVPINPIFNDLALLKQNMAHLSVFLNFLISNSEPAPMLFSLITDYYQSGLRETGSATRWAFEIYTTFLANEAPLKLMVDDGMVISIESVLRNAKENELRTVFRPAENFVRETVIMKHLKDFNNKQSIGLGTMFGVHDLKPNMDRHSELRIVDSTLSSHFERLIYDEANDASQALAFCLATFFRQIGFIGGRSSLLLDVCPSFICKDKKVLKYKLKKNYESRGHLFNPHLGTTMTKCQHCEKMLWGIGYQGYQCSNCELVIHRRCADVVWCLCSGTLRRAKEARRGIMPGRSKAGREDSTASKSIFHIPAEEVAAFQEKRADDMKTKTIVSSNEKVSNGSDDEKQSDSENEPKPTNGRPSSWPNIFAAESNSVTAKMSVYGKQLSDPDFDVESELPPLSEVISKEAFRKLKGKERKKQEYINELFYTEKTHLRQLKVIDRFFRRPIRDEGYSVKFVSLIFQNLDEAVEIHGNLNNAFKKLRAKNEVVTEIGDTLAHWFSGDNGLKFRQMASKFCQDQLFALGMLKATQKKDPRLLQILQEATLGPHSGRQELKDLLPREMQRLTKYPLLIDNICNCTPPDTEEREKLTLALKSSKELLEHVNQAVREFENYRRTQDMQKRLDRKPIESSTHPTLLEFKSLNLTQHKMIYDGELTWRRSPRAVELHMALFEHFIVLLQKQDDRLVLRCQSTAVEDVKFTYSPIIKLAHLLTKDVATDKRAFFLVNKSSEAPQVHELVANSKEEKNRWCSYIKEAVERYHKQYSNDGTYKRTSPTQVSLVSSSGSSSSTGARFTDITDSLPRINQMDVLDLNESMEETAVLELGTSNEIIISEGAKESFAAADDKALPELQQKIALVNEVLCDKVKLLSDVQQPSSSVDGAAGSVEQELVDDLQKLDPTDLIAQGLDQVKLLSELSRDAVLRNVEEEEDAGEEHDDDSVTVSATELLKINNRIQQLLALLTVGVVCKEEDNERLELELCASRGRLSAILADTNRDGDSRLEIRSPDLRQPTTLSRPTSYMAALSETNYKLGPSSLVQLEEETVHQSLLTEEPASDDNQLTTQDDWNSDDQRVSMDTVSFI